MSSSLGAMSGAINKKNSTQKPIGRKPNNSEQIEEQSDEDY